MQAMVTPELTSESMITATTRGLNGAIPPAGAASPSASPAARIFTFTTGSDGIGGGADFGALSKGEGGGGGRLDKSGGGMEGLGRASGFFSVSGAGS